MDTNTRRNLSVIFNLVVILSVATAIQPLSPGKGCAQTYATAIKVYQNQLVTLSCPICTNDWSGVQYQWFFLSHCSPPTPTDPCWLPLEMPLKPSTSTYSITVTVKMSEIYRCVANGTYKNMAMRGESGPIQLDVDQQTVDAYCKGLLNTTGITVLIAGIPTAVILVIIVAVVLHFKCKKRIAKQTNLPSGREPVVSCTNFQRDTNHCRSDNDDDGYIIPLANSQPEGNYMEIAEVNCRPLPRIPNTSPKLSIGPRRTINHYENTNKQMSSKQNKH